MAVVCPSNSSGPSVAQGCTCGRGFKGLVVATEQPPYYHSTCQVHAIGPWGAVAQALDCPKGSRGASLPSGCRCKPGEQGSVEASVSAPCLGGCGEQLAGILALVLPCFACF